MEQQTRITDEEFAANIARQFALLGSHNVRSWQEANAKLQEIAASLKTDRVVHGTGYPIREPHLLAVTMDAWSGEGMGYNLTWYPEGDTYESPRHFGSIRIGA